MAAVSKSSTRTAAARGCGCYCRCSSARTADLQVGKVSPSLASPGRPGGRRYGAFPAARRPPRPAKTPASRIKEPPMGVKAESLILQISAEPDRGDQEKKIAEDGLIPIALFANGPENAYLLGARATDLDAAFEASRE